MSGGIEKVLEQGRKIIHIDMDAFYASVEQRDHPELSGKPVSVGGSPNGRGVVAAASYEARKYGVRSAMSARRAKELCPALIFVKPRILVYARISRVIQSIMREYTPLVEPLALDEAFLDVTTLPLSFRYASQVARKIRERVFEITALPCSAGVSDSKFMAKLASKSAKPDGLFVIQPDEVLPFLDRLLIRELPGVGSKTEEKFHRMGITHVRQLRDQSAASLAEHFGKQGAWLYELAHGRDAREVKPYRERKSIGAERTFGTDLTGEEDIREALVGMGKRVWERATKKGSVARSLTVKMKTSDFELLTRSITKSHTINSEDELTETVLELYENECPKGKPLRLLGVALSHLEDQPIQPVSTPEQLSWSF